MLRYWDGSGEMHWEVRIEGCGDAALGSDDDDDDDRVWSVMLSERFGWVAECTLVGAFFAVNQPNCRLTAQCYAT